MLGVSAVLGRGLLDVRRRAGAPAALLLTHEYWPRSTDSDPTMVGRIFEMNDRPHTVVGVLAPFPQYPQKVDVYMPTSACPFRSNPATMAATPALRMVHAIGGCATACRQRSWPNLARHIGHARAARSGHLREIAPGSRTLSGNGAGARRRHAPRCARRCSSWWPPRRWCCCIACVSVSNLTLARLTPSRRKLSLRAALGATRRRLCVQLLTENVSAVAAGVVLGLLLAQLALGALTAYVQRGTRCR